jgi:hypothetical protein
MDRERILFHHGPICRSRERFIKRTALHNEAIANPLHLFAPLPSHNVEKKLAKSTTNFSEPETES